MDSAKAELADKLKNANNILVTVSRNPSVDQLAACIGLTLFLNKLGKHAAAVFSGQVPSTIEFLQPEETLEKNTDSLRDFIIALDKSKADKLRYKVEDNVVRIFITPYRTSISQADLEFSQGDFNVDVVVALGVQRQEDLDEAITAHGRILHDATVASINTVAPPQEGELGSLNWREPQASSLSELVTELGQAIDGTLLDSQIATALLTGIVAETHRFSNDKTSSQTMSASAALMAAGANQQLVATKLEEPKPPDANGQSGPSGSPGSPPDGGQPPKGDDGTLEIPHDGQSGENQPTDGTDQSPTHEPLPEMHLPPLQPLSDDTKSDSTKSDNILSSGSKLITEAPTMGGMLTANTEPEGESSTSDPLTMGARANGPLLDHMGPTAQFPPELTVMEPPEAPEPPAQPTPPAPAIDQPEPPVEPTPFEPTPAAPADAQPEPPKPFESPKPATPITPLGGFTPPPPAWVTPQTDPLHSLDNPLPPEPPQTLSDLEQSVQSPHLTDSEAPSEDSDANSLAVARDEVSKALTSTPLTPEPIQALNAQPLGNLLHSSDTSGDLAMPPGFSTDPNSPTPSAPALPTDPLTGTPPAPSDKPQVNDPTAPPPVPPPIPFQFRPPGQ
jgi:hypothetical protein